MAEPKTILVIDDDSDIHFFCKSVLEAEGFRVLTAASGESGLALARTAKPDLIILDIMMERIDTGYSVAEKLGREVPILMFSSMLNPSDETFDADTAPFSDVVRKPIEPETLLRKVRKLLV